MLFVFIYGHWSPTLFTFQIMFVSFNSNVADVTSGTGTAYPSAAPTITLVFSGVLTGRALVFFAVFCIWLFVLLTCSFLLTIVLPALFRFTGSYYNNCIAYTFDFLQSLFSELANMCSLL